MRITLKSFKIPLMIINLSIITIFSYTEGFMYKEKRRAPVYRRQAKDEPAGRLFFNLFVGLAFDLGKNGLFSSLEPMALVARHKEKRKRLAQPRQANAH
jgi:hypothetical protein